MDHNLKASAHGKAVSPLPGADAIMNQALFLGTYPGLTVEMLKHEIAVITEFVKSVIAKTQ
jgi:CDP-6-deoxy-D-xylo-4-hexulose-3-dehydrase